MLYMSSVFNISICLKVLSTENPQLICCKTFWSLSQSEQFLTDTFHSFGTAFKMPYHPRKSVGFIPFSAGNASKDFTLPKSSIKSFTKATSFLNNESLNNVHE